jgi:hypothetical protein
VVGTSQRCTIALAASVGWLVALGGVGLAEPVELRYRADPGCPDQAAFWGELGRRAPAAEPGPGGTRIEIDLVGEEGGHRGVLRLGGDEREIRGDRCAEVAQALALIAALALPIAPPPAPAEVVRRPPPPSRPATTSLRAGLGVAVVGGAMPSHTVGFPLFAEVDGFSGAASLRLSVATLSSDATLAMSETAADFRLLVAVVDGCALPLMLGAARLGGCLGLEVGRLSAEGRELDDPQGTARPWLAPIALARARLSLGRRVTVEAAAGAGFPLVRDRYLATPSETLHEIGPIGLRSSIDLGLTFW